jgi:hypothetical protein
VGGVELQRLRRERLVGTVGNMNRRAEVAALLEPVDVTVALTEYARKLAERPGRKGSGAYKTHSARYPQLSDAAQQQLVAAHQRSRQIEQALAAGRFVGGQVPKARRLLRTYLAHRELLLGMLAPLCEKVAMESASERLGAEWARRVRDDIHADAYLAAIDALDDYPATQDGLANYVAARVKRFVKVRINAESRSGTLDRSWERTARLLAGMRAEAERDGETLTTQQLYDRVRQRVWEYNLAQLGEVCDTLDQETIDRLVQDKMTKSGMARALAHLPAIDTIAHGETSHSATIETPEGEIDRSELLADRNVDVAGQALGGTDEDRLEGLYRLLLGDDTHLRDVLAARLNLLGPLESERGGVRAGTRWSAAACAAHFGLDAGQVRQLVRQGERRLAAPHAQWAHLSGTLEHQYEREAAAPGALGALLAATA